MSSSPPDSPETPTRSLNRLGLGSLAAIQLVLLGICLIAANYLSTLYYSRTDQSRGANYTLSKATTRYLAS